MSGAREPADPKHNPKQAADHPWRHKMMGRKPKVLTKVVKKTWTCPSCGSFLCEYGECVDPSL